MHLTFNSYFEGIPFYTIILPYKNQKIKHFIKIMILW